MHYSVYNRGREYRFVFNCALLRRNHCTFSILTPIFTNFLVLVANTTLLHLFVLTHISFISTATFIELRPTITKVILIPVVQGESYLLSLFSLLLLMIIYKHYSTYTHFTAFVSKTVFYITNYSHNSLCSTA